MPTKRKKATRQPPRKRPLLLAQKHLPREFRIGEPANLELSVAESADGKPKVRGFRMTAYTGGAMRLSGFYWPVVVDLSGVQVRNQARPILFGHDVGRIVGHSESVEVTPQRIRVAGKLSGIGNDVQLVLATADNGFPWQASIGAETLQMEFIERGNTVKVNGRNFDGPVYVSRNTSLREFSFVALGADDQTSASIAAINTYPKESEMGFSQWLQANGWDETTLTENQKTMLRAIHEDETDDDGDDKTPAETKVHASAPGFDLEEYTRQVRDVQVKEATRVANINAAVAKYGVSKIQIEEGREVPLAAHAIAQGWDAEKVELHALRVSRPTGPAIHVASGAPADTTTIEAAICLAAGMPNVEKVFKPEILEAAHSKLPGFGIQQALIMAATANGYAARPGERIHNGNLRAVMEHAFPPRLTAASTMSLPGILSNVANKELLQGFTEENEQWREIAATKSVSDFKQVTSYRMLDNMEYEELAPDGTIKHGEIGEETYTRQAKTYAKMFSLTRTDIINDDLGAFDDLRQRLGRGAKKKFNNIFWKTILNNSSFYTSGRGNYISGATTNLATDGVGLEQGVTSFRKLRTPTGDGKKRIGGRPDRLLIPPELEFIADRLYVSARINNDGPDANIHANKYRPIVVDWLSDPEFTGFSATAWYLFRNPLDLASMTVSFLNGNQTPVVESADADFNTLGVQFRGYHDFGCDQAEYLSGVKSKGAA